MNNVSVKSYDAPPVNEREILRYAKCSDDATEMISLMRECLKECEGVLTYNVCWSVADLKTDSADLARNLASHNCTRTIIFAATVGLGIDRLIRKYERLSPTKALFMQAIGAERVEALCDAFEKEITRNAVYHAPRFSPGYGDLPLTLQTDIARILDMAKHIGITLNDSLLMSPSKSVTAIIGIGD